MPPLLKGRFPHCVGEMSAQADKGGPPPSAGGARLARDGGIHRPQKAAETLRTAKDVRPYARIKFTLCHGRFFADAQNDKSVQTP